MALAGAYGAAAVGALALAAAEGARHPIVALVVFSAFAFLVGLWSHRPVSVLTGPVVWMCLNGFVINRYGELHWHGTADTIRFTVLSLSGIAGCGLGALVSLIRHTASRDRTLSTGGADGSRALQPWEPELPGPEDVWFWN
ncbi:hypothetical protein ACWGCW_28550 [Streptomyces sp. NPDC054933]